VLPVQTILDVCGQGYVSPLTLTLHPFVLLYRWPACSSSFPPSRPPNLSKRVRRLWLTLGAPSTNNPGRAHSGLRVASNPNPNPVSLSQMAHLQLQFPTLSPTESLKESWPSLVSSNPHSVSLFPALQMARLQLQSPTLSPTESLKESWPCALRVMGYP